MTVAGEAVSGPGTLVITPTELATDETTLVLPMVGETPGQAVVRLTTTGDGSGPFSLGLTVLNVTVLPQDSIAAVEGMPTQLVSGLLSAAVNVTLSAPPVNGTVLDISPVVLSGNGTIAFQPATVSLAYNQTTFEFAMLGGRAGDVTVGFVVGNSAGPQYNVDAPTFDLTVIHTVAAINTLPAFALAGILSDSIDLVLSGPPNPGTFLNISLASGGSGGGEIVFVPPFLIFDDATTTLSFQMVRHPACPWDAIVDDQ